MTKLITPLAFIVLCLTLSIPSARSAEDPKPPSELSGGINQEQHTPSANEKGNNPAPVASEPVLHPVKATFTFSDGRTCEGCTGYMTPDKLVMKVVDANGYQWTSIPPGPITYDEHPQMRRFGMALQNSSAQYNQQRFQQQQMQLWRQRNRVNCRSYGVGNSVYTNCY